MTSIEYRININAPIERVFALLTEAEGLAQWMAVTATAELRPGGELRWTHENGATMIGRYVEIDAPTRVVFSYGWEGDLMGVPPESSTVEIRLIETEGTTEVLLEHRDLPEDTAPDHEHGWKHFLAQMAAIASE